MVELFAAVGHVLCLICLGLLGRLMGIILVVKIEIHDRHLVEHGLVSHNLLVI